MFKRILTISLTLLVAFAIIGCGNGTTKPPSNNPNPNPNPSTGGGTLTAPATLKLNENQYSTGYSNQIDVGTTIKKDDEWSINVKFTVDRNVPGGIQIGLVDTVTDYWNPLSWDGDVDDDDPLAIFNTGALVAGTEYTLNKKFVALKDAGGTTAAHNKLVFQTEKEYTRAESDNGKSIPAASSPGPVTITFVGVTPPPAATEVVLYNGTTWLAAISPVTVANSGGNTNMAFGDSIDTTGFTKVYFKFDTTYGYKGGSVEGNDTVGSSTWVNHEYWSGFEKIGGGTTDTFAGALTDNGDTVGALKKLCVGGEDQLDGIEKIWME